MQNNSREMEKPGITARVLKAICGLQDIKKLVYIRYCPFNYHFPVVHVWDTRLPWHCLGMVVEKSISHLIVGSRELRFVYREGGSVSTPHLVMELCSCSCC